MVRSPTRIKPHRTAYDNFLELQPGGCNRIAIHHVTLLPSNDPKQPRAMQYVSNVRMGTILQNNVHHLSKEVVILNQKTAFRLGSPRPRSCSRRARRLELSCPLCGYYILYVVLSERTKPEQLRNMHARCKQIMRVRERSSATPPQDADQRRSANIRPVDPGLP